MTTARGRALGRIGLLGVIALCSACGTDCAVVGAACPVTYAVSFDRLATDLGGLAFSLATTETAKVSILTGRATPAQLDGVGERRAIVIGAPPAGPVAKVRFEVRPAQAPTVALLDAAKNQAGSYAAIAVAGIRVRTEEVPGEK